MKKFGLFAAIGAALGSTLRYAIGTLIDSSNFPWATFTVNVVGSLLIGLFLGMPAISKHDQRRVFLITGVLGGFTTFSAFALETLQLDAQLALLYLFSSIFAGTVATTIGFKFGPQS